MNVYIIGYICSAFNNFAAKLQIFFDICKFYRIFLQNGGRIVIEY